MVKNEDVLRFAAIKVMVTSSNLRTAGEGAWFGAIYYEWCSFFISIPWEAEGSLRFFFTSSKQGGEIGFQPRDNVVATMSEVLFLFKCWLGHKYLNCFGMQKFAAGRPKCKHSKWKKGFLVKGGLPFDVGLIHVLKRLFLRNVLRLAFRPSLSETSSFRNQWGFDLHIWNTWVFSFDKSFFEHILNLFGTEDGGVFNESLFV